MSQNLEDLVQEYKDFYRDKINDNKNNIVTSFLNKNFDEIKPLMDKNEKLQQSGFQHAIGLAHTLLKVQKYETNPNKMHQVFNKQFEHIETICEADSAVDSRIGPTQTIDHTVYKRLKCRRLEPLELGKTREQIKAAAMIESAYERDGEAAL